MNDWLTDLKRVIGEERWVSGEELEEEDSKSPEICSFTVSGGGDTKGRQVGECESIL